MTNEQEFKELEELAKPVVEYLKKNYNPMCKVEITTNSIEIFSTEIGIPELDWEEGRTLNDLKPGAM